MGVIRRIVGAEGTGVKMEHWFDDLTKRLATPGLSRREMIGMTVAIVIAGRTPTDDGQARLLRSVGWSDIDFYTFDDLTSGVVEILRHVAA